MGNRQMKSKLLHLNEVPLGEAFLCLQGAVENLETATKMRNISLILKRRIVLEQQIKIYEHSVIHSNKNSFVVYRYLLAGKDELNYAFALLEQASQFLSSHVALV
jgi:predicted ATPase